MVVVFQNKITFLLNLETVMQIDLVGQLYFVSIMNKENVTEIQSLKRN